MNSYGMQRQYKAKRERIQWLDLAKFVAIAAVLLDHNYGVLYTNDMIRRVSWFSVGTFILASGYGTELAFELRGITYKVQIGKIIKLVIPYALANAVVLIYQTGSFSMDEFVYYLLHFNIQGPYYYFALFFQLLLIAPILLHITVLCHSKKHRNVFYIVITVLLFYVCGWLTTYTTIYNIYGGGGRLFGGSYLLLFYLGIVFAREKLFTRKRKLKNSVFLFGILLFFWCLWNSYNWKTQYTMDSLWSGLYGDGINPPGVCEMVSAVLIMPLCYALDSCWSGIINCIQKRKQMGNEINAKIILLMNLICKGVCFLGKNTLYIFLYHLLVRTIIIDRFNCFGVNEIWPKRILVYMLMLIIPAVVGSFIHTYNEILKRTV